MGDHDRRQRPERWVHPVPHGLGAVPATHAGLEAARAAALLRARQPLSGSAARALQRTVGNAAVTAALRRASRPGSDPEPALQRATFDVGNYTAEPASRPLWYERVRGGKALAVGTGYDAGITFSADVVGRGEDGDLDQWTVGFIQTMKGSTRAALYDPSPGPGDKRLRRRPITPTPVRDGSDAPWYKADGRKGFSSAEEETVTITTGDQPRFDADLVRPADLGEGAQSLDLVATAGADTFTTWVAARHGTEEPLPLELVGWKVDFGASTAASASGSIVTPGQGAGLTRTSSPAAAHAPADWVLGGKSANDYAGDAMAEEIVTGPGKAAPAKAENPYVRNQQVQITTMGDLRGSESVADAKAGKWTTTEFSGKGEKGRVVGDLTVEDQAGILICIDATWFVFVPAGGYAPG